MRWRKGARALGREGAKALGREGARALGRKVVAGCVLASTFAPLRLCAFASFQTPDADAIVRRAGVVYRGLSSLQADFEQIVEDAALGDTLRSSGQLTQAGPVRFAMRFSDPPDEALLIDGRYIWVYTPSTNPGQVIRSPVETDPVYGENLLLRLLDKPNERYAAEYVRRDTVGGRRLDVVSLVPRTPSIGFRRAVLWLDAGDALPRRIEIDEGPGQRRILILSRLRPNAPISPATFRFEVPPGVRVVSPPA